MTFYTYRFFAEQNVTGTYVRIAIATVLLLGTAFVLFLYLRNRWRAQYRDLAIILAVASLLTVGMQFQNLTTIRANRNQTSSVMGVLATVAKREKVDKRYLQTNSTSVADNMLVYDEANHHYYRLIFSANLASFVIEKIQLQATNRIKIVGAK